VGEEDTVGWRIASASHAHRRTADSGKRCGGVSQAEGGSGDRGGRRPPGGPEWAAQASWAGARFSGQERKGRCSGLSWAKRPGGLGVLMGWRGRKFQRKGVGLPWIPGRTDFGLR
jgi:hypothetical protein